jgi:hypothetical protein
MLMPSSASSDLGLYAAQSAMHLDILASFLPLHLQEVIVSVPY